MLLDEQHIDSVIPQRNPFIMISNLLAASETNFETDFFIRPENIFIKSGIFQETGMLENIAQSCAAGFGYLNRKAGGKPMIGFIGAVSKTIVHKLPEVNSRITTTIRVVYQLENVFLVSGQNYCENEKLLECEMKIVVN